jgi:hypothetical protein
MKSGVAGSGHAPLCLTAVNMVGIVLSLRKQVAGTNARHKGVDNQHNNNHDEEKQV